MKLFAFALVDSVLVAWYRNTAQTVIFQAPSLTYSNDSFTVSPGCVKNSPTSNPKYRSCKLWLFCLLGWFSLPSGDEDLLE